MGNYGYKHDRGAFYQGGKGRNWRAVGSVLGRTVFALYDGDGVLVRDANGAPVSNLRKVTAMAATQSAQSIGVSVRVEAEQLEKRLEAFPEKVRRRILRQSMRKWAKLVLKTVVSRTPRSSEPYKRYIDHKGKGSKALSTMAEPGGGLRRSMTIRVRAYKNALFAMIGPRAARGGYTPAGWRVQFAEVGAYNRKHKRRFAGHRMLGLAMRLHGPALRPMLEADIDAECKGVTA